MKILLTSDNHLGFKENDPIVGNDSFNTLEEILQLANERNVDLILQGGDLFHDNQPSKEALGRTLQLLNKYCVGIKRMEFEANFKMNCFNEHICISMPIISIHGNHDDPSGITKNSVLEVLEHSNFINYVGKHTNFDNLEINPIILHGNAKIAIYPVGNVRDRRIYKIFKEKKIKFNRPSDPSYFNILLLHQNRIPYNGEDYVPIEFIDDWFDLVIFGHEHEPIMYKVDSKGFTVLQAGSTVRTSLSVGEKGTKYSYILDINEDLNVEKIPLKSVRELIFDNIQLNESESAEKQLLDKVNGMIGEHVLPYIRLRVEHTGDIINKNKFGLLFKNRVANYLDIIKYKKRKIQIEVKKTGSRRPRTNDFLSNLFKEELVAMPESYFIEGVRTFLENGNKTVFTEIIDKVIENGVKKIQGSVLSQENVQAEIYEIKKNINDENGYPY